MDDREKLISDYRNKIREHLEVEAKYGPFPYHDVFLDLNISLLFLVFV